MSDGARLLLDAAEGGDEPVLVARRLPGARVLCGPRRADLARTAVRDLGADALLLDDGFQHRALARDLDVVVLDAANPFGNGRLLPAGPNREPRRRAAPRRARVALPRRPGRSRRARGAPRRSRARPPAAIRSSRATRPWTCSTARSTAASARPRSAAGGYSSSQASPGPAGFRRTLAELGADVVAERLFPDHHRFAPADLEGALRAADAARCDLVVTTEKDAVRLPPAAAADPRLRAVRIEAEIVRGEEVLDAALDEILATSTPTEDSAVPSCATQRGATSTPTRGPA